MRIFTLILLLTSICFAQAQTKSPIITNISSTNLVEGEVAIYNLIYRESNPLKAPPEEIKVDGLMVKQRDYHQQFSNGSRYFIYEYVVFAQKSGTFEIPSLDLEFQGKTVKSPPATINVESFDSLTKERFNHKSGEITCYSRSFVKKSDLYPGESVQIEYKIYIPARLNPQGWGLPKPDKTINCTAWRFQPPSNNRHAGQAIFDNQQYSVASYTTVLSSIKPGPATFGPLSTDLIIAPSSMHSRFGFTRRQTAELPISSAPLTFNVLEFPTTPPSDFNGAVGEFTIEAQIPAQESISLNDSITATVTIEGSGNLPDIVAPELEDTTTWKVVDVSKVQQGEERKLLTGKTQFTYILQPKRGADALPRFTFAHFDPNAQEFFVDTTATSAITVTVPVASGSAVLPAADVPQENMQDILGPLVDVELTAAAPGMLSKLPVWSWQAIPALALLGLLCCAGVNRLKQRKLGNSDQQLRKAELKVVADADDRSFLKLAGGYAERWLSEDSPLRKDILTQRDAQCYQPSNQQKVDGEQRKSILRQLKKFALLTLMSLLCLAPQAEANDQAFTAWQNGDYQSALELYLSESKNNPESADLLYNVGNGYYRTNQSGKAALYYSKALALDPSLYEAQKNLSFVQKVNGSVMAPEPTSFEAWVNTLPAEAYKQLAIAFAWILLLSILALKLFKLEKARFGLTITALTLSPILAIVSISCWFMHPQRNINLTGAPAMVTQFTPVLTEPINVSGKELEQKTMIQAPAGSPCRIIAERDNWLYIELANGTRGWASASKIGEI